MGTGSYEDEMNEHDEDVYTDQNDDVSGEVLYQEDATAGGMHVIDTDEYLDDISIEGNRSDVRNPEDRNEFLEPQAEGETGDQYADDEDDLDAEDDDTV